MQTSKRDTLYIISNSTAYYLLSYLTVYTLSRLAAVFSAGMFNIPNTLFYNRLEFNGGVDIWTFDSVKVVYSSGNILSFLLTILFLVITIKALELNGLLKLFFLWGFIHSISLLLGSIIIGAFNFEGFGIVLSYLYLADTAKMLLLFTGIILLMATGMAMVNPMLFSANIYYNFLTPKMRTNFKLNQFVYPFLISTPILFVFKFPLSLYESLLILIPMFLLLPLFWSTGNLPTYYFEETEKSVNLNIRLIIITVGVFILYRLILGVGINFGKTI